MRGVSTGLAVALAAVALNATTITGGPVGLPSPTQVVTFDELGDLQGQVITTQFAARGVTLSGVEWDGATMGQAGSTGFSGGDLVNGVALPVGPVVISFAEPVWGAAFAVVDQDTSFTVEAYRGGLGGTLVESFGILIPFNPGAGFIGFEDITFDTIRIFANDGISLLAIDTLQIQSVPEPATSTLMALGLVCAAAWFARKRAWLRTL
jgi:hypothetical protein